MNKLVTTLIGIISVAMVLASAGETLYAAAAQTPAEQLYAELAKLKPDQRAKRLEEGARKEGKLIFVHTWRGKIARDFGNAFEKRYSYIKFEMSDLGSQDAAERFIAEERTGRHLTDILSLAVPDLAVVLKQNLVARYPTPATDKILKQYSGFIDKENRWTAGIGANTGSPITPTWSTPLRRPKNGSICVNQLSKGRFPLIRRKPAS